MKIRITSKLQNTLFESNSQNDIQSAAVLLSQMKANAGFISRTFSIYRDLTPTSIENLEDVKLDLAKLDGITEEQVSVNIKAFFSRYKKVQKIVAKNN